MGFSALEVHDKRYKLIIAQPTGRFSQKNPVQHIQTQLRNSSIDAAVLKKMFFSDIAYFIRFVFK